MLLSVSSTSIYICLRATGAYRLLTIVVGGSLRWLILGRAGAGLLLGDGGGLVIRLGRGLRRGAVRLRRTGRLDSGSLVIGLSLGLLRGAVRLRRTGRLDSGSLIVGLGFCLLWRTGGLSSHGLVVGLRLGLGLLRRTVRLDSGSLVVGLGLVVCLGLGLLRRAGRLSSHGLIVGLRLIVCHGRGLSRRAVSRSRDRGGLVLGLGGAVLPFLLGFRLRDGHSGCRLGFVDCGGLTNAAAAVVILRVGLHNGKASFPLASLFCHVGKV